MSSSSESHACLISECCSVSLDVDAEPGVKRELVCHVSLNEILTILALLKVVLTADPVELLGHLVTLIQFI